MSLLNIKNLSVSVDNTILLSDVNFDVEKGDCIALLGPNGHGKSTLLNSIMGNPIYKVINGSITFLNENITNTPTEERSKKGIFLSFQTPIDIPGLSTVDFYRAIINSKRDEPISLSSFYKETTDAYKKVNLDIKMIDRSFNDGFSGGEKKRNEILQMLLLKPSLALIDEVDSGLDVDSLKDISKIINELKDQGTTFIIVSHYDKLYENININKTALLVNGSIKLVSDASLAKRIATEGYSFLKDEYNINIVKKEKKISSIETCAVKKAF